MQCFHELQVQPDGSEKPSPPGPHSVRARLGRKSRRLCLLVPTPDGHSVPRNFLMDLLTFLSSLKVALGVIRSLGEGEVARGTWAPGHRYSRRGSVGTALAQGLSGGAGPMAQGPPGPGWPCRLAWSVCRWLGLPHTWSQCWHVRRPQTRAGVSTDARRTAPRFPPLTPPSTASHCPDPRAATLLQRPRSPGGRPEGQVRL